MRWVLWMRSWYRASFCEKHCICCRLRISWSIRLGVQRYESLLALSSALLPLNTGDWVLDIRPSGHHIHTSHSRSLAHTQTNTHTHHTYITQVESDGQFPHNSWGTRKEGKSGLDTIKIKFVINLIKLLQLKLHICMYMCVYIYKCYIYKMYIKYSKVIFLSYVDYRCRLSINNLQRCRLSTL